MGKDRGIHHISRRTFLRGLGILGAVTVPLPLFDFMLNSKGTAHASGVGLPLRFLVMKSGNPPTLDGDKGPYDLTGRGRNMLCPTSPGDATGKGYALSAVTQVIGSYAGLQDYMGFFAGCDLPHSLANDGLKSVPLGGYCGTTHETGRVLATGRRMGHTQTEYGYETDKGPSADQLVKAQFNASNQFVHANYTMVLADKPGRHNLQFDLAGNQLLPNTSMVSMFNELFTGFTPPGTAPDPAAVAELAKRKSILDQLDKDRVNFLKRELSAKDQTILSSHFEMLRDLEQRITNTAPGVVGQSCKVPTKPASDPVDYPSRGDLIVDLLTMGFACDRVRHGTYQMTDDQCFQDSSFASGVGVSFHQLTHSYGDANIAAQKKAVGFVFNQFVKLAGKLKSTPEGSGNLLDNTVIVYHSEAGAGTCTDSINPAPYIQAHSHIDHCVVVAGKAGGVKTGRYLDCSKLGPGGGAVHPTAITLAAMKAVGYTGAAGHPDNELGDVKTPFGGLWTPV